MTPADLLEIAEEARQRDLARFGKIIDAPYSGLDMLVEVLRERESAAGHSPNLLHFDSTFSERPEVREAARLARAFSDHMRRYGLESATVCGVRLVR